jgi:carbon-monoxide dehydrogenase large subunit
MTKFALGQPVSRLEDTPLIQGKGRYSDDVQPAGAAHAFVLRSPHAHAAIRSIDTQAAKSAPGVLAVLTGEDARADGLGDIPCLMPMKNRDGTPRGNTPRPVLAKDRVRHVGDPVALVVAETLAEARDASELIEVDYDPLPAVADTWGATQAGAAQVWPDIKDNICFDVSFGDREAVDAAFGRAAHVAKLRFINNRVVVNALEPRTAVAEYDAASGRCTLHTPTQGPFMIFDQLVGVILKIPKEQLRVVSGNVGGGFGMKIFAYPEQPLVVWAARRLKRSVRWTGDRSETFLSDNQGRDHVSLAELALDGEGRFLALRATTWAGMGAYLSNFGPGVPTGAFNILSGVYRIPAVSMDLKGVITNTVPVDAYRGAGRPEAIYLIERIVDVAALELGLAPDEIRRRNFISPEEMPWKTAVNSVYDSGEFQAAMERCMQRAEWAGFPARRAASAARGRLRGIGLAMYIERCGAGGGDTVSITVSGDEVLVLSGMQDNGQGHTTGLVQLISDRLGIDAEKIRVIQGDTDISPKGYTGGSRFLAVGGTAALKASDDVLDQGRDKAAAMLEAAPTDVEYAEGRYRIAGTDRSVSLFEVAAQAALKAEHSHNPKDYTFPNGCHIVELELDPDTGAHRIERYTIVDDFGRTINPLTLAGQVHGGTVQGIGQALLEHTVYDPDSAQLLSGSFMDYTMPRADDVPMFDFELRNVPCKANPLGVKGAGEAGAVGAPPAVISALVDALRSRKPDLKHVDMPATREKIWRVLVS